MGRTGEGRPRRQCRSTQCPPTGVEGTTPRYPLGPGEGLMGEVWGQVRQHPDEVPPPPPTERRWEKRTARSQVFTTRSEDPRWCACWGRGEKLAWQRSEVRGCGRAHHSDKIPAAVLAHQLLLATATLDDAAQPPIEHDVGAVRAVALSGVGCASHRIQPGLRQG